MRQKVAVLLALMLTLGLAACGNGQEGFLPSSAVSSSREATDLQNADSPNILIAYYAQADQENGDIVEQTAALLQENVGGSLLSIGQETSREVHMLYEWVFLGFSGENSVLPEPIRQFLTEYDFGASTIFPFVVGRENHSSAILSAVSELQPGALLGDNALILEEDTDTREQETTEWIQSLGLTDRQSLPAHQGDTVAAATVTPHAQQVFYLWEADNVPAVTEYTVDSLRGSKVQNIIYGAGVYQKGEVAEHKAMEEAFQAGQSIN